MHNKVVITLSENILDEIEVLFSGEICDKNEFVHTAIQFYLRECKKKYLAEQMKQGYMEMSEINLHICGENILIEEEALCNCMHKLLGG